MQRMMFVATFAMCLFASAPAFAACWRLPNGTVMETQSNSTPPVYGAVRVTCPNSLPSSTGTPPEQRGVTTLDERRDPRECVDYARSRVSSLPRGLFSLDDKRRIINDNRPRRGSVAIINESAYGHVAYIEDVTSTSITISETNYRSGRYTRRRAVGRDASDAAQQLRIIGYYRP